jgi:SAM-dependent methyltransferase
VADVASSTRWEAERRQGERIVRGEERAWGWSSPAGQLRALRRAKFLVDAAGLGPGVRCLELGCGTGEFTVRLVGTKAHVVAVDLSEATVAIARERVAGRAKVVVGNVETGEGIEGRFDAIVGVSVLHHVDLEACFANAFSKLRPGGRFAFSEPNMANPQVWLERRINLIRRLRRVTPHETAFRAEELRDRFERAGFVVEVCEPFDFIHPSTPRVALGAAQVIEPALERTALRRIAGSIQIAGHRPRS